MSLFGSKGTSDSAGGTDGTENTNETLPEPQTSNEASSSLSSRMGNAVNVARMGLAPILTAGALYANTLAGGPALDNRAPTSLEPHTTISAEAPAQSPLLQGIQSELRRGPTEEEMQAQEENNRIQEINEVRESLEGFANEQEKQNEAYREEGKILGEDAATPQIVAEPETPTPPPVEPAPVVVADAALPVEVATEPTPEGPGNAGSSNGGGDGGA